VSVFSAGFVLTAIYSLSSSWSSLPDRPFHLPPCRLCFLLEHFAAAGQDSISSCESLVLCPDFVFSIADQIPHPGLSFIGGFIFLALYLCLSSCPDLSSFCSTLVVLLEPWWWAWLHSEDRWQPSFWLGSEPKLQACHLAFFALCRGFTTRRVWLSPEILSCRSILSLPTPRFWFHFFARIRFLGVVFLLCESGI
jgi:hypothetical protein